MFQGKLELNYSPMYFMKIKGKASTFQPNIIGESSFPMSGRSLPKILGGFHALW
jgi:hypothetical protein